MRWPKLNAKILWMPETLLLLLLLYWYTQACRMHIIDGGCGSGSGGDKKWNRYERHLITTLHPHIFPELSVLMFTIHHFSITLLIHSCIIGVRGSTMCVCIEMVLICAPFFHIFSSVFLLWNIVYLLLLCHLLALLTLHARVICIGMCDVITVRAQPTIVSMNKIGNYFMLCLRERERDGKNVSFISIYKSFVMSFMSKHLKFNWMEVCLNAYECVCMRV